ncbi:hypothetical protein EZS27_026706 [termite gut metagenome]|uniref:Bro-N domain-containing protein n=1 Tax=termite gut metagenome TaxID=433724 RepID=A0A5J4QPQ4_9ZZZZ
MQKTNESKSIGNNSTYTNHPTHETGRNQSVQIFENPEFGKVRTILSENGEPLFCLADLCKVLNLSSTEVNRRLEKGVVSKHPLKTSGGVQQALFVNEDGLYDVILESRKPETRQFRKWVTSEILPSVRKSGGYSISQPMPTPTPIPRYSSLIELAKQCPDVNITLKVGELIEAIDYCVNRTRKELEQQITDANTETYPSADQVTKILDVDRSTLHRWWKKGYLTPIEIGGKRRYKMSDINKILSKG